MTPTSDLTQAQNRWIARTLPLQVYLLLLCALLMVPALQAQRMPRYTFTVLTNAGVNLRKGPGTEHPKLVTLPFGTVVDAKCTDQMLICQGRDTMPPGCIKIEGRRGYWMQVTHKDITGYVFSGFGWIREKQENPQYVFKTPSSPILDYQLLQLGMFCYNEFDDEFDPRLNWYGLKGAGSRLEWVKVNARIQLGSEFVFREESGDNLCAIRTVCDVKEVFLMLGSRQELSASQLKAISDGALRLPYKVDDYFYGGKEIRRDERYSFEWAGIPYELHGFRLKSSRVMDFGGYSLSSDIGLELRIGKGSTAQYFDLAKSLEITMDWERRETSNHSNIFPRLTWAGDINQDGLLDMLFFVLVGYEGCGMGWTYTLILGKKTAEGYGIEVAAVGSGGT